MIDEWWIVAGIVWLSMVVGMFLGFGVAALFFVGGDDERRR